MSEDNLELGSVKIDMNFKVFSGAWFQRSIRDHVKGTATVYKLSGPHDLEAEVHYIQLENGERWVAMGESYSGPKWIWKQIKDRLRMSISFKNEVPMFDLTLPTPGNRNKEIYTMSSAQIKDFEALSPHFFELLNDHGVVKTGPRSELYEDTSSRKKFLSANIESPDCMAPIVGFCMTRILALVKIYEHLHSRGEVSEEFTHMVSQEHYSTEKEMVSELDQLIASGESASVEFKSTIWFDINQSLKNPNYTPKKETYIQDNIIKTIAGFLNSEGGSLIVGVSDDGNAYGLDADLKFTQRKDLDGLELELTQLLMNIFSKEIVATKIRSSFPEFQQKTILRIDVKPSNTPIFAKTSKEQEAFYVRIGNLTQIMSTQSAISYIAQHTWDSEN
jgi:hypothetical protein